MGGFFLLPLPPFLRKILKQPFTTLDELDLNFHGFQFNILRNDEKLRKAILEIFCIPSLVAWVLLGADSTADQVANFVLNAPNFVLQEITLNEWIGIYNGYYGLGTHWSAAVIYSLLLIGISKHLRDKLDVKNSLNLCLTTGFVGITIACFEFFWMGSYYVFQNQHWIFMLKFPQLRIIVQNILFLAPGVLVLLGFNWKEYKLNVDKITVLAFLATITSIVFWWYYPFSTPQLTVGNWVSSPHFPQTMYTIQPTPNVAYGIMYHIEDAGVHLTNNLVKILMTLMFYSLFKIKRRENICLVDGKKQKRRRKNK